MDYSEFRAENGRISEFKDAIHDPNFPCVGAKSALVHDQIEFFIAHDDGDRNVNKQIVAELQNFARKTDSDAAFVSFVVLFENMNDLSEMEFEEFLWQRLQSFHDIDNLSHKWDPAVSNDPESPDFSMSLGGRGFYVIGLHPKSSRKARRFKCPALVFNLHSQFELLRQDGRYEHIHDTIIARDITFSGSVNPMLATFGEISEARQYSGRIVDDAWKCPLHVHKNGDSIAK